MLVMAYSSNAAAISSNVGMDTRSAVSDMTFTAVRTNEQANRRRKNLARELSCHSITLLQQFNNHSTVYSSACCAQLLNFWCKVMLW